MFDLETDVFIAGGGIAGMSLAYFLAAQGKSDVIVADSGELGAGATRWSFGGVRQQFSTELEIRLAMRGLDFWKNAEQLLSSPCPFAESGYLFVTSDDYRLGLMAEAARLQVELGCESVEMVTPQQIETIAPWMNVTGLVGGSWTPHDGHVTATDGIAGMYRFCKARGTTFVQHAGVTEAQRDDGGWSVSLDDGRVLHARQYVVAAGLASGQLLDPLGHNLELRPLTLRYALTEPALPAQSVPLTIDFDTGMSVEREGDALLLAVLQDDVPESYGEDDMLMEFSSIAATRAPALTDIGIRKTITAETDLSMDGHPYVGQLEDNLWVLTGFSGHGIMHGPGTAEQLALMIRGRSPSLDISALSPTREKSGGGAEWMVAVKQT